MSKEKTLNRLIQSRQALCQAIEGLSEAELTGRPVEGTWTIKDLLGHITAWDETCLKPLRRCLEGGAFEAEKIDDYLAWNEKQAARRRDFPLKAILDEMSAVRQELLAVATRLPAEQWEQQISFPWGGQGTIRQALGGLAYHEMEHVHSLQESRQGDQ